MNRKTLIKNAESCTGCSACVNACPCKAVSLAEDEYGFVFPEIDGALCTDCGICTEVCAERNNSYCTEYEQECWYGQSKNEITLKKAASGGLFTEFAQKILEDGGVVFGAAMSIENGVANVYHKSIESEDKLYLLQNSKYVQSDVGFCYAECKDFLDAKRRVLFSGTPCQIAGLKAYLGNREYENLITIDIICHGVPSLSFFNRYLQYRQEKSGNRLASLKFREKEYGWSFLGTKSFSDGDTQREEIWNGMEDSYYKMFLLAKIYRESCYSCKYACRERTGDITVGDFWKWQNTISEKSDFDPPKGVSCYMINSENGKRFMREIENRILFAETDYRTISNGNAQLVRPNPRPENYDAILGFMKNENYSDFDEYFRNNEKTEQVI